MTADASQTTEDRFALVNDLEFGDGVIEAEIAGDVQPGASERAPEDSSASRFASRATCARSMRSTCARPTGEQDDQVRRNHSAQYISHPDWTWSRFRQEFPSKYESYVDLAPGTWTKVRDRGAWGQGASLRPRRDAADADRQRPQDRAERQGRGCAVDRRPYRAHFRNLSVSK